MATTAPANDFQAAAQALVATANRTFADQIFHDALQEMRAEASSKKKKKDKDRLQLLASIRDDDSLRKAVKDTVNPKADDKWSRKVARVCEKLERPFELFWRISETSTCLRKHDPPLDSHVHGVYLQACSLHKLSSGRPLKIA